jgi:pimeloyl-ACP methyl ester carboxylesterase
MSTNDPLRRRFLVRGSALGAGALAALAGGARADAHSRSATSKLRSRQHRLYVDGPYGQIHVTVTEPQLARPSAPDVLCLPMSPRSGRDFDAFARALADRRRVFAPDLPGFGGSDPPPNIIAIDDYAAAMAVAARALGLGRRGNAGFDLVGQHTGAAVAIELARRQPRWVRRLATIGVPLFTPEERERLRALYVRERPYFEDPEFLAKTWQRDVQALSAGQSREEMLLRFVEIMRAGPRSHWGFDAVFRYPMRERLAGFRTPMLAIVLNENLAAASREAAGIVERGEIADLSDLPGSALDFASARLANVAREYFDRERLA